MRYYISDLHFFHEAMLQSMDCRGFSCLEEMHEYMIDQWNRRVRKKDEVVILGDFSVAKGPETALILSRLKGKLGMIRGNHDWFLHDKKMDWSRFQWIEDYKELHDEKRKVILSHYPVFCYHGQYRLTKQGNPGSYMLYGHVHNTFDEVLVDRFIKETRKHSMAVNKEGENYPIPCHMINCFCMFSDYTPLTLDEWIERDLVRREKMGGSGLVEEHSEPHC